ncbi:enoyl-CoA hydratase/isomerase family protein [Roseobacter sp. HKCCD9010]|uniref:enoyl-CoA hydratase/isomerase family protein n=1 Tax=unclassified Roseobacter TaxID=196798 RepID=UPI0014909019|nr:MULTISPECIES: enoyl-CoA hydratase/isomerase family protein [unclassified Roseobacter]MBF9049710.1 enoyl-CoA hydratase/isomerase family protein [Rhodobacterales bacterium HKCCD4356]NNV11710.1 enoyl-CoA hydratase/isomerase family protein [Roseobacter sp. HKCCD7357]NNV15894.1 enoyl-CoA hydratase/isomerase family protein [Roseobacter sp. HKCCD8768]NNV25354.1 enoyl-CoA hydratase/isomerase family protein [Roseobacter sp. HKCCD8192]NNV29611.1 enoyl-CoA hydratase/isomerase family protein [Roseobact
MSAVHLHLGPIARLELDNPAKLNAFTPEMLAALEDHCATLDADSSVLGVLLTAAPAKAFCAGADILAWGGLSPADFARHWVRDGHRVFDRLARLSKPTIAVLGGHAFGGGLELAAACDIRVIAPQATLALPETSVGIVPGWSGTQRLLRLLPEPVVKEMALFGRRLDAERALALGFVADVADDPLAAAEVIAACLAQTSPRATEVAKYLIHAAADEDRAAVTEALAGGMIAASADKAEGVAAFTEKRKPDFPGT